MRESRILLNNAAVLESTFRELDPAFTTCFRYEDMADPDQAARVSQFVAPTDYVAQRLGKKMLANVKIRPSGGGAPGSITRVQWEQQRREVGTGFSENMVFLPYVHMCVYVCVCVVGVFIHPCVSE